jgi:hypothetical protein
MFTKYGKRFCLKDFCVANVPVELPYDKSGKQVFCTRSVNPLAEALYGSWVLDRTRASGI